jgi:hypothetical protein
LSWKSTTTEQANAAAKSTAMIIELRSSLKLRKVAPLTAGSQDEQGAQDRSDQHTPVT